MKRLSLFLTSALRPLPSALCPLLSCLWILASLPAATAATGDFLFQKKTATGYEPALITPANGQVLSWSGGAPVNLDIAAQLALKAPLVSPALVTPALGTPTSGNFSSGTFTWPTFNQSTTGNAATVTTNANLTGPVTSVGNATAIEDGAISGAKISSIPPTVQTALDLKQHKSIGFFDRFDRADRYPEGSVVTDGVTLPEVGSAWEWKANDTTPLYTPIKMRVLNGGLRPVATGGGYLAASATPVDPTNFRYGFEFAREQTQFTTGTIGTLTVTTGYSPATASSTHNAPGHQHMTVTDSGITQSGIYTSAYQGMGSAATDNLTITGQSFAQGDPIDLFGWNLPGGITAGRYYAIYVGAGVCKAATSLENATAGVAVNITSDGIFGSQVAAQGEADNDTFTTTIPHGFITGDYVVVSGAGLPAGITAGGNYAIVTGASTVKIATTRALALAGTAVDMTTDGASTAVLAMSFEILNRAYRTSSYIPWIPDQSTVRTFQGSNASDNFNLSTAHNFSNGDAVMLEGDGLPTGVVRDTVYYVTNTQSTTVQLAATKGGSAITLSSDGSATQVMRGVQPTLTTGLPYGRRSYLMISITGDIYSVTLAGVGTIDFKYRNLAGIFGNRVAFYWQPTPARSSTQNFTSSYALYSVSIDAPEIEDYYMRRNWGYTATLSGSQNHKLPGRLDLTDANQGPFSGIASTLAYADTKLYIGASGRTLVGGTSYRYTGGNAFAEGAFLSMPGFTDGTTSNIAIAPAVLNAGRDAEIGSATTVTEVRLDDFETIMTLQTGDQETVVLTGYLTGTNAKRIRLAHYNAPSTTIFDSNLSGTPLDAIATPFRIEILRKQIAGTTHVTYTTMYVNGTVIGPQRATQNYSTITNQYYSFWITQADAQAVKLESILQTVNRVTKP